ncbi:hypothetical protein BD770DRAFT_416694 [Pilaira anomala]|nr:hypothetical protein BD770DRAFT_416694 [Pilaira anomala]
MNNDSMTINNYIAYKRRENQEDPNVNYHFHHEEEMNPDVPVPSIRFTAESKEQWEVEQTQQHPDAAKLAERFYQLASTADGNENLLVDAVDLFHKKIQMGVTLPNDSGQVFLSLKKDNELVHANENMDIVEEVDDDAALPRGHIKRARFGKICNVSPDEIKLRIDDYQVVDTDLYQAKAMSTLTCEAPILPCSFRSPFKDIANPSLSG